MVTGFPGANVIQRCGAAVRKGEGWKAKVKVEGVEARRIE